MKTQFFENIQTISELRNSYLKLVCELNLKNSLDATTQMVINQDYDTVSKELIRSNDEFSDSRKIYEQELSEELRTKVEHLIHLPNISFELLGGWLWINSSDTFDSRDELLKEGFTYSYGKALWFWKKNGYSNNIKKGSTVLSIEQIRDLYKSEKLESNTSQKQLN